MAEGGTYLGEAGHSESRCDSLNGPRAEINGYHTQPESTGVQCLDTDGDLSISEPFRHPNYIDNGAACTRRYNMSLDMPQEVSYPPFTTVMDIAQSASGFSDTGMNIPSNGHLQQLPSESSLDVGPALEQSIQTLSLNANEGTRGNIRLDGGTRGNIRLDDFIALERDQNKVVVYRQTKRSLLRLSISEDTIIDVVVRYGLPCLESRSTFFRKYDREELPIGNDNTAQRSRSNATAPLHPRYKDNKTRLETYKTWPGMFHSRKELCDAGLYYTGVGDNCVCYHCGQSIMEWEEGDSPVGEHYRLNNGCLIARQMYLGRRDQTLSTGPSITVQSQIPNPTALDSSENKYKHRICQVCKTHEIGVSQFWCGHVVCVSCVPPEPPDEGKRFCKLPGCGREIEYTTAYDSAVLMNGGQ